MSLFFLVPCIVVIYKNYKYGETIFKIWTLSSKVDILLGIFIFSGNLERLIIKNDQPYLAEFFIYALAISMVVIGFVTPSIKKNGILIYMDFFKWENIEDVSWQNNKLIFKVCGRRTLSGVYKIIVPKKYYGLVEKLIEEKMNNVKSNNK